MGFLGIKKSGGDGGFGALHGRLGPIRRPDTCETNLTPHYPAVNVGFEQKQIKVKPRQPSQQQPGMKNVHSPGVKNRRRSLATFMKMHTSVNSTFSG